MKMLSASRIRPGLLTLLSISPNELALTVFQFNILLKPIYFILVMHGFITLPCVFEELALFVVSIIQALIRLATSLLL